MGLSSLFAIVLWLQLCINCKAVACRDSMV